MTTFEDGPAKGQTLMLHRAPVFLRVVEAGGKFDALDQLEDTPEAKETIYAYQRVGEVFTCHILRRPTGSGWYSGARYRLLATQPTDAEMRDNEAWRKWCHSCHAEVVK